MQKQLLIKNFLRHVRFCGLLWIYSFLPVRAATNAQDSASAQVIYPDSLRVTVDAGEFRWRKFRYEAEVRVAPIYLNGDDSQAPAVLYIWVNLETPGASLWLDENARGDYLTLRKGQPQAKAKIRWFTSGRVKLTAQAGRSRTTVETHVVFPVLLLLAALCGGALGGWLRRARDPSSVVNLHVRLLPEKWSRRLTPIREVLVSMIAGILLYLLNEVSPIYLGFRATFGEEWLALVSPLLIGFLGGWGGINLLVGLLEQLFGKGREAAKAKAAEPAPPATEKK
jgi:hypothetical protein